VSDRQTTYVFESLPMQFSAEKDSLARRGQLAAQHGGDADLGDDGRAARAPSSAPSFAVSARRNETNQPQ
jgi:hypothetical protein